MRRRLEQRKWIRLRKASLSHTRSFHAQHMDLFGGDSDTTDDEQGAAAELPSTFGGDSDTTSDGKDDTKDIIGAQGVQSAASAVELHPPPPAVGRALFARAVSDIDTDDTPDGGGETKGEDPQPPPPHPSASFAAVPVKTLPSPVYDGDNKALITLCTTHGSLDEARDLIARGINLDEQNTSGMTALMIAVTYHNRLLQQQRQQRRQRRQRRHGIAQMLIRAGAALDLQDKYGMTALMIAVRYNHPGIAQELVRAGAALDLKDNNGSTAVLTAVVTNRPEIMQTLICAGAALDLQNNEGRTALQLSTGPMTCVHGLGPPSIAREIGRTKIATLLREAGARCRGYARSGWFNSTCKRCGGSKVGRWHDEL